MLGYGILCCYYQTSLPILGLDPRAANLGPCRYKIIQREQHMAGMLQIITYLLGFYLIMKGVEILQIGISSSRTDRVPMIAIGVISILACAIAAYSFIKWQDEQAQSMQRNIPSIPSY
jgi:hypothetical protein